MDTINEMSLNDDVTMAGGERALLAGRYRVVKQLGAGGMGSVWLVEDTTLDNKLFAVKMLPSILVSNRRAYDQLKREALVAMKLVHPGIVTLRSFEENGGNPFLVMDYIEGWTLDDFLAENGKFTEEDTVALLRPVADALDYAHSLGIVHRDIKPANIMIGKDWRPYILDFGIAREMQETMTRVTGRFSSGTLMYMSPEQLNGSRPGPSQDIYSFAATVYECLTGEPPFCRGAIEDQIKNRPPEPLDAGVAIGASVIAGLAKKAEDRPKTCAAVLEVRRRIAAPVPATKRIVHAKPHTQIPHTRMRANKEPAIPPRRCNPARKRWWLIAVAAAVLCAAAGLFFVSSGAKSNDGRKKARAQAREEDRQAVPAVVKAPAPAVKEQPPEPPEDPPEIPPEEINTDVEVLDPSPVSDMTPVPAPPSPSASVKPAPADTVRAARAPVKAKSMTNSRNPGAIGSRTGGGAEYGDSSTEVAVLKVLWWLKATQRTDGSWAAGGQKGGATSPIANTGFAILTYLAHGEYEGSESPWREDFGPVVSRAINYLVSQLDTKNPNKPVMHGSDGNEYAFLIATYALCEAYGMTRDPVCKETAMVTLQRIIDNQSPTGGWDYKMNKSSSRDDLSYAGWALQALKAGKMSGMKPDGLNDCIKKAVRCLKTRSFKSDHFAYCAGGNQH
nr:protein kinase [Kiritimatiellia bacterium]